MLLRVLRNWCEYIFPERNDYRLVRTLTPGDLYRLMRPLSADGVTSLLPFNEPSIRALIHEAKFHHNERAWQLLALILEQYLRHTNQVTVLPIPLSRQRERVRGYNQVAEIVKRVKPDGMNFVYAPALLLRSRNTVPQTSLPRSERLKNLIDAFTVSEPEKIQDTHIIILDDVTTTGATLKAAAAALKPYAPASITLLALAH